MPRKKVTTDEWSIRITPANQEPITDFMESGLKDAEQLIVCEEGTPNGKPVLHYHIYMKSKHGRTTIENIAKALGRSGIYYNKEGKLIQGNAVYSLAAANAGTIGYNVKSKNVVASVGVDNHVMESYFQKSEQYMKDLQASRRRDSRKKESSYKEIFEKIVVTRDTQVDELIEQVLDECSKRSMNFPSRSLMESNIFRILYPHKPDFVRSFYRKNFEHRY